MKKITYLVVLEPFSEGYGVYFPDLPGCVSAGADIKDAQEMAEEALSLYYYGMEEDGDEIPEPSLTLDPDYTEGNIIFPITIYPELFSEKQRNRKVKTNTTIAAWLKIKAEEQGINFSSVLENALLKLID